MAMILDAIELVHFIDPADIAMRKPRHDFCLTPETLELRFRQRSGWNAGF